MVDGASGAKYFADHFAGQEFLAEGCDGPVVAVDVDADAPLMMALLKVFTQKKLMDLLTKKKSGMQ